MTAARTLVAWCPDWPVVASGLPAGEPVAVLEAGRVVACSEAARVEGVQRGLRRRQAEARCPGLTVLPADPGREARAFEPVVAAIEEAFTPRVEIVRPGVCAFATRGPSRYFGGDAALAARVAERVVAAGVPRCQVGVADGRFAAERAARVAPAGTVIPPGQSAAFLAPLPVATLAGDRGLDLPGLLVRLGVRTLGELAALPARAVLARFGVEGLGLHRLARGLDEQPLVARTPPPDLTVSAEIDPPAEQVDTVAFVARSLATQLHDTLAARGLALALVRVEAETEHGESLARTWRLDRGTGAGSAATNGAAALAERVRWQLDGWLSGTATNRPTAGVTLLRLVPEEVGPDGGSQVGFWGGDRAAAERVARALERVQGRLGPQAVATAVLAGGRGPAEQVRLVPWGDSVPRTHGTGPGTAHRAPGEPDAPWPGRVPRPAPATVPDTPVPVDMLDAAGVPVGVNGRGLPTSPPAALAVAGRPVTPITAWAGPWPADERWWDPPAHRRRARWQVVTADGAAHLLCLEAGRWSLEGTYD